MSPTLLTLLAALLGLLAVAGVGMAFAGGGTSRQVKRAQQIAQRSRPDGGRARAAAAADPMARRKQILKTLKEEEKRQRKVSLSLDARLRQAGLSTSVKTFWMISAALAVFVFLVALFFHQMILVGLGLAIAAGFGLPRWVIGFMAKRRAAKFTSSFADAADIIVRGIKSGLPVHECLHIIARESPEPLASEFRRLVDSVAHGMSMDQALDKLYERMSVPELRFFAIVLSIQQKAGGNLAEALTNLSAVLRARKLMREKIKAMAGEATASAAIIGSLPPAVAILITLTTPTYLTILFTDNRGKILLLIGATWMSLGVFTMRKMINFKF